MAIGEVLSSLLIIAALVGALKLRAYIARLVESFPTASSASRPSATGKMQADFGVRE